MRIGGIKKITAIYESVVLVHLNMDPLVVTLVSTNSGIDEYQYLID